LIRSKVGTPQKPAANPDIYKKPTDPAPASYTANQRAMSALKGKAENICSHRAFPVLTDTVEKVFSG
jgi:hypothetical protein